ncbi:MAG: DUF4124 domain-containing protein [Gammaproteobacteria bacterium]|nr:DUF4124 domain-containing protein [Gammaproteobacteria bacterium]
MKATTTVILAICLLLISGVTGAQDVYKWVDENGVTSFGETPPDNARSVVRTNVRYSRTDPVAVQARVEENQAYQEAVDTRKQQEGEEAADAAKIDAENEQVRKQNCQLAMDRAKKYEQARRLYRAMEGGGRDYLTDQELDEERAAANLAVNEWCSKK